MSKPKVGNTGRISAFSYTVDWSISEGGYCFINTFRKGFCWQKEAFSYFLFLPPPLLVVEFFVCRNCVYYIVKHYYIITASDEKESCKNLFHVDMKCKKELWTTNGIVVHFRLVVAFGVELSYFELRTNGLYFVKDRFREDVKYV